MDEQAIIKEALAAQWVATEDDGSKWVTKEAWDSLVREAIKWMDRAEEFRGMASADDERARAAAAKAGVPYVGCDTADMLADKIQELRAALHDMLAGWRYIRSTHGDLYGVGWDRAQQKAEAALNEAQQEKPQCTADA